MRLYEFEGAELLRRGGIVGPASAFASRPAEAVARAREIGLPVMVKAQVPGGGRYLAGGVRRADSPGAVEAISRDMLGATINGMPVAGVMVASQVMIGREFYLGVTVDSSRGAPLAILSTGGGVSVETLAGEHPEMVVTRNLSVVAGLPLEEARQMAAEAGLSGQDAASVAGVLTRLYSVFRSSDALVAEINPLARTADGQYLALDAKVEIDDASLYRHPELALARSERYANALEKRGHDIGASYVELDGDIALFASGAGLGMASVDVVGRKLRPANFLDTGGNISEEFLYRVMDLVLRKPGIRAVFINLYGGINPIHEGARGVVRYMKEHGVAIPVVARALGNHQAETGEILRQQGVIVATDVSTEEAVDILAGVLEAKA